MPTRGLRADWRHRRRKVLPSVDLDALENPLEQQRLLQGLQAHGAVVLTLPKAAHLQAHVTACYAETAAFFRRSMREKAPHAISEECQHGCAIYEDGTEFFEVTRSVDPRLWSWPSEPRGLRDALTNAYKCMSAVAVRVLEVLLRALRMDADVVLSTLDSAQPKPFDGPTDRGASHSALRIWSYPVGALPTAWHCDNSLLTLGARGTSRGLRARLLDGQLAYLEDHLGPDQVVLYVGDSLSYLTGGRLLPLMHEVVSPAADTARRLSMPFFLRPRRAAILRPALASPELTSAKTLPPLGVVDLEEDAGGVRTQWEWKRTQYFSELR